MQAVGLAISLTENDVTPAIFESQSLFKDRNFRSAWSAGILINFVRWLEFLALGIYAFDVTGSAFMTALLALARFLPLALFGVIIGSLADQFDTGKLLRIGIALTGGVSLLMTALFAFDLVVYWHVAVAAFLSGTFWASDFPLRRKLIGEIAGPERLGRAMAIDTATGNGSRLFGPLVGGFIYQLVGGMGVFLIGAVFYGLSYLIVLNLHSAHVRAVQATGSWISRPFRDAWQAFKFAAGNREVMALLGVTIVFNIWGFPMLSMVPVIGKDELGISASSIGAVSALEGAAAFTSAIIIARVVKPAYYRRLYYFSVWAVLLSVFLMGMLPGVVTLVLGLIGVGLAGAGFATMQSTLIYMLAPAEMRGRMLGVITICIGSGLIGFANIGYMADRFGASNALWMIGLEGVIPMIIISLGWPQLRQRQT